jgi:tetratricopeptide (TPR) repeat protein
MKTTRETSRNPGTAAGEKPGRRGAPGWLLALALLAAVVLAYQPAWNAQPVWDDNGHITKPALRSWEGLARIWTQPGATQQYYPLAHSVFWLEHRLWGDAPAGYHLVNILLHAALALLLVKVLRRLEAPGAWLAAGLWALHPVQVESVAWISELKNTLSGVCYAGAALAYLRFDRERKPVFYVGALALFVAGLLAKTVVATLPAALLLILWWKGKKLGWKKDLLPLAPFFLAGLGLGLFTAWMERTMIIAGDAALYHLSIVGRFLVAGRDFWFYLGKLAWPHPLIFIYPRWEVSAAVGWQFLFPLAALLLAAGLWRWRQRLGKAPLVALLFFAGTLFPALGFFDAYPFIYSFVADHFQYLASLGPLALAAAGMEKGLGWAAKRIPLLQPVAGAGLLTVLGALTWAQCGQYDGSETLFRATLQENPRCWMAHINLGVILMDQGKLDEAASHFKIAMEIQPNNAEGHYDLGNVLGRQGVITDAIAQFRKALDLHPDFAEAHCNLGMALLQQGEIPDAVAQFRKALDLKPNYLPARECLGRALLRTGDFDGAMACFEKIAPLPPDLVQRWYGLGNKLLEEGHFVEAIVCYRQTITLSPRFGQAWAYLGVACFENGQTREALDSWQKSLEINPHEPQVENNIATVLATAADPTLRDGPKAVALAGQANQATGGANPSILSTLAAAYAEAGRYAEASATARKALTQAQAQKDEKLARAIQEEIKLYDAGRPMHRSK